MVPGDYAGILAVLQRVYASGEIVVGPAASTLAGSLLSPPLGPAAAPLFRLTRLVTVGLLPSEIRAAYGFAWDASRDRAFRRAVSMIRGMRRCLPPLLREWPAARVAA
jgi:uncharacterized protein (DUF2236 family)